MTILFILISALGWTQSIEKTWGHTKENSPYLSLKEGSFQWNIEDNTIQGEYLHQQKLLFLYPDKMQDSIIRFKVETLTDSTLTPFQKWKANKTSCSTRKRKHNHFRSINTQSRNFDRKYSKRSHRYACHINNSIYF